MTAALGVGGCRNVGCRTCATGSGLGSPVLAGPWVLITTKQLWFQGWPQLSPDSLAFYISLVEQAGGRTVWVWDGTGTALIGVMSGDMHTHRGCSECSKGLFT